MSVLAPARVRHEVKFVTSDLLYPHVVQWVRLNQAGFHEAYPARWVNSVYFDTYEYRAYAENLAGVSERIKIRYRWYGALSPVGAGQLEVKAKRDRVGGKQVYRVPQAPAGLNWRDIRADLIRQLPPAGRLWLHHNPQPVIVNRYRREYFASADGRMRATVDSELSAYDQRYADRPQLTGRANLARTTVLEIKFAPEYQAEASRLLADVPIRVGRNSKFMVGLRALHGQ